MPERLHAQPPGRIRRLDARIKLLALIVLCFATQYSPDVFLPLWLGALALLFFIREMRSETVRPLARGAFGFILFWLVMKIGSDMAGGAPAMDAIVLALPLGERLLALSVIGMAFVGLSSPIETGRAVAWCIGPVLGKEAWKPALVIALTAWFLPMTLRLAGDVTKSIRARGLVMPRRKRIVVIIGTALRILEKRAAELAVGLASRRVDDYRTWRE
jgi:ABC-type cobalt transport system, permease component CbiQ and related transporters